MKFINRLYTNEIVYHSDLLQIYKLKYYKGSIWIWYLGANWFYLHYISNYLGFIELLLKWYRYVKNIIKFCILQGNLFIYFFFYWSRAQQLWPLAIVGVTVVTVGRVGTDGMVGWQNMYMWQGFWPLLTHYGWSPIRELVAETVAYVTLRN